MRQSTSGPGEIIGLGEKIRRHPELGFKEFKTARVVEDTLRGIGLAPKGGLAITGVRADAVGRAGDGPTFALLGELDGLVVPGHPFADPQTGAAHACGHNAQVAGMLGAAMGLLDATAFDHLAGTRGVLRGAGRGVHRRRRARGRSGTRASSSSSSASPNCCASAISTTSTWQ